MGELRTDLPFLLETSVDIMKLLEKGAQSQFPAQQMILEVPLSEPSRWLHIRQQWDINQLPLAPSGRTGHDSRRAAAEMLIAAELHRRLGLLFDLIVDATTANIAYPGIIDDPNKHLFVVTDGFRKSALTLASYADATTPRFFVFEVTAIEFSSPIKVWAKVVGVGGLVITSLGALVHEADELHGAFELVRDGYEFIVHRRENASNELSAAYLSQMRKESSSNQSRTLQSCLKLLGFDPGPIDGRPGHRTQATIAEFARVHNLAPDIRWDNEALLTALSRAAAAVSKINS
jgi:hypothetical protein